jgi:hypothetical protein
MTQKKSEIRKKTKRHASKWTEEEIDQLIKLVEIYQIERTWGTENKIVLWNALAKHIGRSAKSAHSKYSQLRRLGKVQ